MYQTNFEQGISLIVETSTHLKRCITGDRQQLIQITNYLNSKLVKENQVYETVSHPLNNLWVIRDNANSIIGKIDSMIYYVQGFKGNSIL